MRIHSARFITSAPRLVDAPDFRGLPEFAFVGRSNVGKSSFINALTGQKQLAKTSNTPGKTQLMNFYYINEGRPDAFVLVDLPGYGYAKVSKTAQAFWQKHLEDYLMRRESLHTVFQLIDSRHEPQQADAQMLLWLRQQGREPVVVLTKTDKLKKPQVAKQMAQAIADLALDSSRVLAISATSREGLAPCYGVFGQLLSAL